MPGVARTRIVARAAFGCALMFGPLLLEGCAKPPPANDPDAVADFKATNDPLEPTNRFFYRVSNSVDKYTLKPVAQAYVYVLPTVARTGIHNMLVNIGEPVNLADSILEAKPRRAGDSLMRFAINSTVGIGGILDVAKNLGYVQNDSVGALTLAYYGLPEGPYLFLPVLGPSSPRGLAGFGLDIGLSPYTYVPRGYGLLTMNTVVFALGTIDARALVLHDFDELNKTAIDPYATVRSAFQQQVDNSLAALKADNRSTPPDWYSR